MFRELQKTTRFISERKRWLAGHSQAWRPHEAGYCCPSDSRSRCSSPPSPPELVHDSTHQWQWSIHLEKTGARRGGKKSIQLPWTLFVEIELVGVFVSSFIHDVLREATRVGNADHATNMIFPSNFSLILNPGGPFNAVPRASAEGFVLGAMDVLGEARIRTFVDWQSI